VATNLPAALRLHIQLPNGVVIDEVFVKINGKQHYL
tara:strand:+ start:26660 stop:26767 length:108 start_codon:yes stop_codon:yes gene_type:complete